MSKARQLADLGNQVDDGAITGTNMVVNGSMIVAQRGTSKTGITSAGYYTIDRFDFGSLSSSTWTMTQDTNAPSGFSNSLKVECTTALASPAAGDEIRISTKIEGQNLQHLNYGSADAKQITLSFFVKSNKTGTAALWIYQHDAARRCTPSYTINAANTWEYKTITIPADVSGTINNDNGTGLEIGWYLSAGSNLIGSTSNSWSSGPNPRVASGDINFADATSNYWQITGVCLNVGDSAIDFPHESYGDELLKCQRYFFKSYNDADDPGTVTNNGTIYRTVDAITPYGSAGPVRYTVPMRGTPTVTFYSPQSGTSGKVYYAGDKNVTLTDSGSKGCGFYVNNDSTGVNIGSSLRVHITAEAEL